MVLVVHFDLVGGGVQDCRIGEQLSLLVPILLLIRLLICEREILNSKPLIQSWSYLLSGCDYVYVPILYKRNIYIDDWISIFRCFNSCLGLTFSVGRYLHITVTLYKNKGKNNIIKLVFGTFNIVVVVLTWTKYAASISYEAILSFTRSSYCSCWD